ncbi:MAG: hypothetical protein J6581_05205 [Apibacter sp.]|nr:hypothetical protein [Apibacter sp.]
MNRFYFIIYLLLINCVINAQVGIGTETPDSVAMLDVVSPNNNKGILIPRLTEEQRDQIDKTNAKDGLLIYNTSENCFNYWNKIEDVWNSLCGKPGKSVFTIECGSVKVNGSYLDKTAITSDNKLLLDVVVTKPGSYTISATSSPDNKYFFTKSGDFLSTGTYSIEIPCYGTPENFTPEGQPGDKFTLLMNGVEGSSPCTFNVEVQNSAVRPKFTMDCSTTTVKGIYQHETALNSSNYIEVTIRFDAAYHGAPLYLYTDTVEGISFKSDKLTLDSQGQTSGWVTQTVKLLGEGAPISYSPKKMTIHSNSVSSTATCEATILVAYEKMKLYTIANLNGVYDALGTGNLRAMIKNEDNFGLQPYSIVKFKGWTNESKNIGPGPSASVLQNQLLGSNPPDIVITGFNMTVDQQTAKYYREYLQKGGVMIVFIQDINAHNFLVGLYPDGDVNTRNAVGVGGAGSVHKLKNIDSPIVNGPFGDIRGDYWGEDASYTRALISGIPSSDIEVLSTTPNGDITAFKHKKYNLVFVGDGGFNSSTVSNGVSPGNYPGNISYPMYLGSVTIGGHTYPLYPIPKPRYGNDVVGLNQYSVYNSVFTANAVAWAIQAAQINGINHHE